MTTETKVMSALERLDAHYVGKRSVAPLTIPETVAIMEEHARAAVQNAVTAIYEARKQLETSVRLERNARRDCDKAYVDIGEALALLGGWRDRDASWCQRVDALIAAYAPKTAAIGKPLPHDTNEQEQK